MRSKGRWIASRPAEPHQSRSVGRSAPGVARTVLRRTWGPKRNFLSKDMAEKVGALPLAKAVAPFPPPSISEKVPRRWSTPVPCARVGHGLPRLVPVVCQSTPQARQGLKGLRTPTWRPCLPSPHSLGRPQVIVVSFVRSNEEGTVGHLLRDWRRLNVALSRAKRKLLLVGSMRTLSSCAVLSSLAGILRRRGWVYSLPPGAHRLYVVENPGGVGRGGSQIRQVEGRGDGDGVEAASGGRNGGTLSECRYAGDEGDRGARTVESCPKMGGVAVGEMEGRGRLAQRGRSLQGTRVVAGRSSD